MSAYLPSAWEQFLTHFWVTQPLPCRTIDKKRREAGRFPQTICMSWLRIIEVVYCYYSIMAVDARWYSVVYVHGAFIPICKGSKSWQSIYMAPSCYPRHDRSGYAPHFFHLETDSHRRRKSLWTVLLSVFGPSDCDNLSFFVSLGRSFLFGTQIVHIDAERPPVSGAAQKTTQK